MDRLEGNNARSWELAIIMGLFPPGIILSSTPPPQNVPSLSFRGNACLMKGTGFHQPLIKPHMISKMFLCSSVARCVKFQDAMSLVVGIWGFCIIYLHFDGVVYHIFLIIFVFFSCDCLDLSAAMPVANEGLVREFQPKHKIRDPGGLASIPHDSKTNPEFF